MVQLVQVSHSTVPSMVYHQQKKRMASFSPLHCSQPPCPGKSHPGSCGSPASWGGADARCEVFLQREMEKDMGNTGKIPWKIWMMYWKIWLMYWKIWGDMGKYGKTWTSMKKCEQILDMYWKIWGHMGKCGNTCEKILEEYWKYIGDIWRFIQYRANYCGEMIGVESMGILYC